MKMKSYDHKKIEKKWQAVWDKKKIYNAKNTQGKKFYGLIEFPYPSGAGLHVGHIRSNTAMDIISRKRRMEGCNVLYPIGWDAFGLPTENYAIKTGIQPAIVTKQNTDTFRRQLKELGFSFDWSREVDTTDPTYYKWTQWIFLQMFKKGLAYKAKTEINWCPKDKIGLANEEAEGGVCDRCGGPVEKKEKEQWMLAITKYADRLDKDLDEVNYLEKIKIQQRNWIGKSEGAEIDFKIKNTPEKITTFTTRADTLYGAFAVILAPEHELVEKLKSQITNWKEVADYINKTAKKTDIERTVEDKDKSGVELKGIKAINPISGEEIPVWIADFILVQYGTGAVFADMHDERDFQFAKKYKLPVHQSIMPLFIDKAHPWVDGKEVVERTAIHAVIRKDNGDILVLYWKGTEEWKKNAPITLLIGGVEKGENLIEAAKREIKEETGFVNLKFIEQLPINTQSRFFAAHKNVNRIANVTCLIFDLINEERVEVDEKETQFHDWKFVPMSKATSDINIPDDIYFLGYLNKPSAFTEEGVLVDSGKYTGILSNEARSKIIKAVGGKVVTKFKLRDWVFSRQRYWGEPIPIIHCDKCGYVPVPEKDLPIKLPKVKSYQPTDNGESPLASISKWVNTKCPKCKGKAKRETDTMPNWAGSSWYYLRYVDSKNKKEFASKKALKYWIGNGVDWYNGGMEHTTLHLLYSRFWHKFLYDMKLVPTKEPYMKRTSHGMILAEDGVKMSKSLGNTVDPKDVVKNFGADTLRTYEMFMGPFDQSVNWSTDSIVGPRRFLERVWKLKYKVSKKKSSKELEKILHKTIKKVGEDIEEMRFNTGVSSMMILVGEMEKSEIIAMGDYKKFLQILSPFAPHITEELWNELGEKKSIHISAWPKFDKKLIIDDEIKIVVQVNGKLKGEIFVNVDANEEYIKAKAFENENVKKTLIGQEIKKVIYVKGRLINIVF